MEKMDEREFVRILTGLGLSREDITPHIGFMESSCITKMFKNKSGIPNSVALLMRAYADGYRPEGWPSSEKKRMNVVVHVNRGR